MDALKNGTAFQLAAYSYLIGDGKKWPPTAYFLFPTAQLYSTHQDYFPGAIHVAGPCENEVWEAAMDLSRETKTKLDTGAVEAPGLDEKNGSSRAKQGSGIMNLEPRCEYCEFELLCSHP